ncbi:DUF5994 family protein [Streptomyces longwoodensis]|uniref:DUF5994 family protein n=1 Tax=Streptomyces longwoodensis TaxID=68231 RepID=UPI003F574EF7
MVPVDGHVVKVGWFTQEIDPHKLLLPYGTGRWDLLVIPPETRGAVGGAPDSGRNRLRRPALSASALIAADRAGRAVPTADRPLDPDEAWEYEGGTCVTPEAVPAQPGDDSRVIIGM